MLILILVLLLFLIFVCVMVSFWIHEKSYKNAAKAQMIEAQNNLENVKAQIYFFEMGLFRKNCIMNITRIAFNEINNECYNLKAIELKPENGYGAYLPDSIEIMEV